MVRVLMERGIDVTTPYQGRMTPLMLAAEKGHLKLVELLLPEVARIGALKSEGDQIDQRVYAMGLAAREGHAKVVATLLAKGVPVDSRDASGETALMRAAMAGSGTVAKLLLKQGANTRLKNHKKETALDLAKDLGHGYLGEKDHKKIMRLLKAHEK